jgi:DNA-binding response OmpR family regulator
VGAAKILLVEDDQIIRSSVEARLTASGLGCVEAATAEDGLKLFFSERPDLCLLDVGLPEMDGFQMLDRIRELSDIPVIFLTARGEETDRVRGLRAGADDYVVKPFSGAELMARIESNLRRYDRNSDSVCSDVYSDTAVRIDFTYHSVEVNGRPVRLTPYEFRLLGALVRHPRRVLSQGQLLDLVWGSDAMEAALSSVRLYVGYLRGKIEADPGRPVLIETVRGFGYRYCPPAA